ncbi:hypothetical protein XAC3810_430091 [Xanthomonas citri pv. citri]|nr:hypothetical protein XAC1083_430114 [Xanthomonas citri pv. citri]CEE38104.1 hypothetical protein XAC3810_430091 [Xanthomonas citri pv. citri]CEE43852.1 hypothetical protein XAC908_590114 [Xanthomonas citri pv. citri]CEE60696.1 hypothetical protein XAC71A_530065 [Xanthomonas citri pv. citri]CEE65209.1 hypothetical protein XACW160_430136 [Xanthomonas citri pv. citri]
MIRVDLRHEARPLDGCAGVLPVYVAASGLRTTNRCGPCIAMTCKGVPSLNDCTRGCAATSRS